MVDRISAEAKRQHTLKMSPAAWVKLWKPRVADVATHKNIDTHVGRGTDGVHSVAP